VSILSDDEYCDPGLLFWLVEELLDGQTIAGCRKIFDYLESRRERLTAKHFKHKTFAILRACNELLRRLSRAEDTAFCGRVFIFLFQSFPLGDKSSVNLRGEYHLENVTTYDELPQKAEEKPEPMEVDSEVNIQSTATTESKTAPNGLTGSFKSNEDIKPGSKSVTFDSKEPVSVEKPLDPDTLYPIFWSLQQNFSQPKKLFDSAQFSAFKTGLEATMVMFKSVQNEQNSRGSAKSDESKRGTKRKRGQNDDDLTIGFNPKYLTSRDLFELEVRLFPVQITTLLTHQCRSVISLLEDTYLSKPLLSLTFYSPLALKLRRN
jgi:THO complex subunit 1